MSVSIESHDIAGITGLALLTALAVLAAVSCGGDGGGGGGGAGSPSPSNLTCPSSSVCDEREVEEYGTCIMRACDAQYQGCFGADYATGNFGGVCGSYYGCLARCSCNDNACRMRCGIAPADCQLCIANTVSRCAATSGCAQPACAGPSTAPLGCGDLMRCCAAMPAGTMKTLCDSEYAQARTLGDAICDPFVRGFKQLGACP